MELKQYQREVINDLNCFLDDIKSEENLSKAYEKYWNDKNVRVGFNGVPPYKDNFKDIPNICFKVPTGGGKTFIACNSLNPIINKLEIENKIILWLVPSDSILQQTLSALKDTRHPYRKKLNIDFNNNVQVYTKQDILLGQDFNELTMNKQLSIIVLTFDTFRITNKENRKIYQENSNYKTLYDNFIDKNKLIENAEEMSFMQIIHQLRPIVVVDESHNATSDLSIEMIQNINPKFILELTATPKENSNIISYIDAYQLKKENMVKLPVIAYNRPNQQEVIADSIDLRNKLETQAVLEEQKGNGKYIRPIVLFQAQPRNSDDSTTFSKIKEMLINIGIPKEEIAIKTGEINDLKNIDLLSKDCSIRYIITVDALKEGWDCPFAYILASLANKTSKIVVEQIVGRILRQPFATKSNNSFLNMSYVLTSSNDFKETLESIIVGLNNAGFSKKDYRIIEEKKMDVEPIQSIDNISFDLDEKGDECGLDVDITFIKNELEKRNNNYGKNDMKTKDNINEFFNSAEKQLKEYEDAAISENECDYSLELQDKVDVVNVKSEFLDSVKELEIPLFSVDVEENLFGDTNRLLNKELLSEGFSLTNQKLPENLTNVTDEVYQLDVRSEITGSSPIYRQLDQGNINKFKQYISSIPNEKKIEACRNILLKQLESINYISVKELHDYIDRIISRMNSDELNNLEDNVFAVAFKIRKFIEVLLENYRKENFLELYEKGIIKGNIKYKFSQEKSIMDNALNVDKGLYETECDDINNTEHLVLNKVCSLENILWWHRVGAKEKNEFYINGFINHYPDFIFMTKKGNVIVIEVKGEHLQNTDSEEKIILGRKWQEMAGTKYKYYMVFLDTDFNKIDGAYDLNKVCDIIKEL